MYRKFLYWAIASFSVVLVGALAQHRVQAATGINHLISFQGKMVNTAGTNVTNGSYTFVFSIYTVSSAGSAVWTESKSITVTDGLFQTDLGSVTSLPGSLDFNTDNLYLGINFNADGEMTPRVRFDSVPQAFNAEKVGGLTVTSSSGTLTIPNSKTISFADAFTTSGAFPMTLVASATTSVTFPAGTITVADLATAQTMSNKTFSASTWQGNAVAAQYGGTGQIAYTAGDMLYASGTTTLSKLAAGSNGNCLVVTSNLPAWGSCSGTAATLQSGYNASSGNTITTTDARDLTVTLANTAKDSNVLFNIATGSNAKVAIQSNGSDVLAVTSSGVTLPATGANTLAVTGAPASSATSALVQLGSALVSGSTNGTYLSINAGSGYTGNFLNIQLNGADRFVLTSDGNLSVPGTVNGLTLTNNGTNTLNIAADKTLAVNNSITFSGTDSTIFTLPSSSDTLDGIAATQTLTNKTIGSTGLIFSGAALDIDTAAAESLVLQGRAASTFQTTSGNITLQPAGSSTTANVQIGAGGGGSTTPDLLVLDASTSASDPTGVAGAQYYNTVTQKNRCFDGGLWHDCTGTNFANRQFGFWAPTGSTATAMTAVNLVVPTVNGVPAASAQADSHYIGWPTTAVSGTIGGLTQGFTETQARYRPKLTTLIRTDTSIATQRIWVGLTSAALTGVDSSTTIRYVGVRYSTAAADTTFQCASGNGAAQNVVNTGVTVAINTSYLITVDWSVSGTLVCSISANGGTPTVVTKSTNLDNAGTTNLGITNTLTTLAATIFTHRIGWVHLETQ